VLAQRGKVSFSRPAERFGHWLHKAYARGYAT
jgi:hypothetical protein